MHINTWLFFHLEILINSLPMIHWTGGGLYEFANSTEVMNFSIMKSTSCFCVKKLVTQGFDLVSFFGVFWGGAY